MSAICKLATGAADNGLLDQAIANGVSRVHGVASHGVRAGNWLTKQQAQQILRYFNRTRDDGVSEEVAIARILERSQPKEHFGMGHYSRANSEDCLFAVRGHPKIVDHGVRQMINSPRLEHSHKPAEARHRLERLLGKVRRLEMFATESPKGWTATGYESDGQDIRVAIPAMIERNGWA